MQRGDCMPGTTIIKDGGKTELKAIFKNLRENNEILQPLKDIIDYYGRILLAELDLNYNNRPVRVARGLLALVNNPTACNLNKFKTMATGAPTFYPGKHSPLLALLLSSTFSATLTPLMRYAYILFFKDKPNPSLNELLLYVYLGALIGMIFGPITLWPNFFNEIASQIETKYGPITKSTESGQKMAVIFAKNMGELRKTRANSADQKAYNNRVATGFFNSMKKIPTDLDSTFAGFLSPKEVAAIALTSKMAGITAHKTHSAQKTEASSSQPSPIISM